MTTHRVAEIGYRPPGAPPGVLTVQQRHREAGWLAVMAVLAGVELAWWGILRWVRVAPDLHFAVYLGGAAVALGVAVALRTALRLQPVGTDWRTIASGTLLIALAASAFLPLKVAIPAQNPFWLDPHLASAETWLFGKPPWRLLNALFGGWAAVLDRLYAGWLPVQLVAVFLVLLARPSAQKSRALVAYSLAWFCLGVVAAVLFASVGPVFYDRAFGGQVFAGLAETLRARDAHIAIAESNLMWTSLGADRPGLVAGISAMPSLHVAISLWLALVARALAPVLAPVAFLYAAVIWIASVQLGWHYASDGLVGAIGMLAIWRAAAWVDIVARDKQLRGSASQDASPP